MSSNEVIDNATTQMAELFGAMARNAISDEKLTEIVKTEINKQAPRVIEIRNSGTVVKVESHAHPLFEKVLRLADAGLNVLLTGPAGSGKTHMASVVAKSLNRNFSAISLTAGASESQLMGRLLPTGDGGKFEYSESPFVRLYEQGGVFLLDEMDAADPNMLLIVNTALANGGFHCELRTGNEFVKKSKDAILIGAANTFGTGADSIYVGRSQLDAATLDRWYVVQIDYDSTLERSIIGFDHEPVEQWKAADTHTAEDLKSLGTWVLNIRKLASQNKLRRVISTRAVQKAMIARVAGIPTREIKRDLLAGWTADEKRKVGE